MDAAWKGLDRETVQRWLGSRLAADTLAESGPEQAQAVIEHAGLRCVGWHHWTGDPATSTPLFVFDEWPS